MTVPGGTSHGPLVHRAFTFAWGVLLALLLCGSLGVTQAQTVTDIQPRSGAPGTAVRLTGTGFDTDATDTVLIGGATATVTDVFGSGTVLTATVPSGASPGRVDATVNGAPAPGDFTVVSGGPGYFYTAAPAFDNLKSGDLALCALDSDAGLDLIGAGLVSGNPDSGLSFNDGSGTFTSLSGLTNVSNASIDCGDFDSDGDLDLVVLGADAIGEGSLQVYQNDGAGAFTIYADGNSSDLTPVNEGSVDWGDIDGDGDLDLLVTGYANDGGSLLQPLAALYENTGSGFSVLRADIAPNISTSDLTAVASGDADFGDIDNDGDLDLVITGAQAFGSRKAMIYTNDGTGAFSLYNDDGTGSTQGLTPVDSSATAFGDMDNDGDLDLVIAGRNASNVPTTTVYRQGGDGTFAVLEADGDGGTGGLPGVKNGDVAWGDADGDKDLDLFLTGSGATGVYENDIANENGFQLLTDDGTGTTAALTDLSQSAGTWGDVDGDGDLDLAVMGTDGSTGQVSVYDNAAPPAIDVTLSGTSVLGTVVDAGRTLPNSDLTTSVSVTNTGTETPLEITGVSGTTPEFSSETSLLGTAISPGGSAPLDLTLNAAETGPYSATINLTSTDPSQTTVSFTIEGRVVEGKATEVRPRSAAPGSTVRIYGAGFTSDTEIAFGSAAPVSPDNVYPSGTAMDVTVPGGLSGPVAVTVAFPGGTIRPVGTSLNVVTRDGGVFMPRAQSIPNVDGGVVDWVDVDGDGDMDLFLSGATADGTRIAAIYENEGGSFSILDPDGNGNTTGLSGTTGGSSDWGDYDGDGDPDLVLTGEDSGLSATTTIYENEGGTGFSEAPASSVLGGALNGSSAWGDVDEDGDLDLVVTGSRAFEPYTATIYRNDGGGSFSVLNDDGSGNTNGLTPVTRGTSDWADIDGDGDLDLLITGNDGSGFSATIYRNEDGTDAFSALDDGDEDGSTDFLNRVKSSAAAFGDYDGDGDPDLVITGNNGSGPSATIYRNDDGTTFSILDDGDEDGSTDSLTVVQSGAVAWGDYDGDGDLDLYTSGQRGGPSVAAVYENDGGTFSALNPDPIGNSANLTGLDRSASAWGDLDGDGDLDLATTGAVQVEVEAPKEPRTFLYDNESPLSRVYVSPDGSDAQNGDSWGTAYRTLRKALLRALPSSTEEIWMAEGRYTPDQGPVVTDGDPSASFRLVNDVDLYGGFEGTESSRTERDAAAHPTILSGDIDNNDADPNGDNIIADAADIQGSNSYNVMVGYGLSEQVRLDGLIVTGGDARNGIPPGDGGGALRIAQSSMLGIQLRFIGNRAASGGAVYGDTGSTTVLGNSLLYGNRATTGSAFSGPGEIGLVNSVLIENRGSAAAMNTGSNITLSTVTATQNEGVVAEATNASIRVENSILWNNNSGGAQLRPGDSDSSVDLLNVLIEGGVADGVDQTNGFVSTQSNVIDADPLFKAPGETGGGGNGLASSLDLQASSPAINAGDAGLLPADDPDLDRNGDTDETIPYDLQGGPRVQGGMLDLGAVEAAPPPTLSAVADTTIDEDTTLDVSFNVGDADNPLSSLTLGVQSSNQALVPDANLSISGTGAERTLSATPRPDVNSTNGTGPSAITITVSDGTTTVSTSFQLTVDAVNDRPVAAPDTATLAENTSATLPVLDNDADVEGPLDTTSVTVTTPPASGTAQVNTSDGTITYTPSPGFSGTDQFAYTVADAVGGLSDPALVTLQVQPVELQAVLDTVRAGTVQTGQDRSISVVVTNTGAVAVSGLSAAPSGPAEDDYQTLSLSSGTLAPGNQASIPVRFAPLATGRRLATLAVSTSEGASANVPLLGTGVAIAVASEGATQGEPATLDVTLNGGFVPANTAQLYARPGGGASYSPVALTTTSATSGTRQLEATVPSSLVTPSGVDYYAVLSDGASTITVPAGGPTAAAARPLHLPVTFEDLTPPLTFAPQTYGMVSVPASTGDGILSALTSAYGEYTPNAWRLLRWDAPQSTYKEPPQIDSLAPGMGAWLVTEDGTPFTVDGTSADASSPRSIPLEPGWNQIGTPFGFAVPWDTVRTVSGTPVDGPVGYRDGAYRYDVPTLEPWVGYFVFNSTATRDTLVVPPVGAPDAEATTNGPAALAGTGLGPFSNETAKSGGDGAYTIELQAHTDGTTRPVWIGLRPDAKAGRDALDFAQAPPVRPSVRLSILESMDGQAVPHAGSFKPPSPDGRSWTLQLSHAADARTDRTVQLHLKEDGAAPSGHQQYLLDLDRKQRLIPGQALSLPPGETRSLKLILGTESYAQQASDGISLTALQNELRGNAPNPFDGATTLSYVLAADQEVTLSVYNVLGQQVRTLVQSRKKRGLHHVTWDGTTEYGRPAGNGVYFYRLEGENFTATRKMVLVR